MKKLVSLALLLLSIGTFAQSEEDQIKNVVTSAYVNGIQNGGSIEDIRKGFHPSFNMLRLIDNDIKPLSIDEWIKNIEKNRAENGVPKVKTEGKFINIDATGTNAVVKLELHREGKKIFTDYLVLYKFTDGWKIVSKSFYRHP